MRIRMRTVLLGIAIVALLLGNLILGVRLQRSRVEREQMRAQLGLERSRVEVLRYQAEVQGALVEPALRDLSLREADRSAD